MLEKLCICRHVVDGVLEPVDRDGAHASPLKESGVGLEGKESLEGCVLFVLCLEKCWIGGRPGSVPVAYFLKRIIDG